jgi:ADP-heptose:LPS heptosyltransferase
VNSLLASVPSWLKLLHPKVLLGQSIIIERHGGIGDVICLLPAVAALRRRYPQARLLFITSQECLALVRSAKVADAVLCGRTRGLGWLRRMLTSLIDCYPLLPDEQPEVKPRTRIHLMEEFACCLGVSGDALVYPSIKPTVEDVTAVRSHLEAAGLGQRPLVVIHVGPTWRVKQWPEDHWQAFVERLKLETGFDVIQAGMDGHPSDPGASSFRVQGVYNWVGKLSLSETTALLSEAKLFVGIDSGLLHLANAVGAPSLGLFGPTDPLCFLPPGSARYCVNPHLACLGCHHEASGPRHWRTDCPERIECMRGLSVNCVLQSCIALLA